MQNQPIVAAILVALLLSGCDPYASVTGNVKVNTIIANNGVPCVMAVGGGSGGLALSCDWNGQHQGAPK